MEYRHHARTLLHHVNAFNICLASGDIDAALDFADSAAGTLQLLAQALRSDLICEPPRRCRVCGCTDDDCSQCIKVTGHSCHWVEPDLCSRCQSSTIRTVGPVAALDPTGRLHYWHQEPKERSPKK